MVKNLPANAGDTREAPSIFGSEDPLEEEMATHSSILSWKIPWTEEAGGLQSTGWQRVTECMHVLLLHIYIYININTCDVCIYECIYNRWAELVTLLTAGGWGRG